MSYDYKCASYSRLSDSDDRIDESSSITTQKQIIASFAKFNNFNIVKEYTDDGFSGGNFDRPGFKKMIKDIEEKKINCVITKDLSRLGREIYKTGEYIEEYFLCHNIRYIAINDGFDSNIGDAMLGIRLGVNDLYLRDVSRKVLSSLKMKQERGEYIGSFAPYGYKKDPMDKHHLIIDEAASENVKKIFNLADSGKTLCEIADYLTNKKIPIPLVYKHDKRANKITANNGLGIWKHQTIYFILTSEMYIGNMRQHVNRKMSYRSKKMLHVDESEYIVVKNTHEAIIDEFLFDRVQHHLSKTHHKRQKSKIDYLFKGLLRCKNCGKTIGVRITKNKTNTYLYTRCNNYVGSKGIRQCTPHNVNYSLLEQDLLSFIRKMGKKILKSYDYSNLEKDTKIIIEKKFNEITCEINNLDKELSKNIEKQDKLYDDRLNEVISVETYKSLSKKCENQIKHLKQSKLELENKLSNYDEKIDLKKYEKCKKELREFISLKKPSNQTLREIIDRIEISGDKTIEVYFKLKPLNN